MAVRWRRWRYLRHAAAGRTDRRHQLAVLRIAGWRVGQQFRRYHSSRAVARRYHCCGVEYGSRKIVEPRRPPPSHTRRYAAIIFVGGVFCRTGALSRSAHGMSKESLE